MDVRYNLQLEEPIPEGQVREDVPISLTRQVWSIRIEQGIKMVTTDVLNGEINPGKPEVEFSSYQSRATNRTLIPDRIPVIQLERQIEACEKDQRRLSEAIEANTAFLDSIRPKISEPGPLEGNIKTPIVGYGVPFGRPC